MASGVRRKVDDLGRVVIPATMRRALGLGDGDAVDITLDGGKVVMVRAADSCTFCGEEQGLEEFHGKVVCWSCLAALRAKGAARLAQQAAAPQDPGHG